MSFRKNLKKTDAVIENLIVNTDKNLITMYARALKDVRSQMADIYDKYSVADKITYAEMAKYNRLDSLEKEISEQLKNLTGKTQKEIVRLQKKVYKESYYRTAYTFEFVLQVKLSYGLLNPKVIEASVQNPISGLKLTDRLAKNRADIIIKTREQITQGLIKGESYQKISSRLKDVYEGDLAKTRCIVQTEAHRNRSQAELSAGQHARDFGVQMKKVWVSTQDDKTRDSHETMNGEEADEKGMFTFISGDNAGKETEAPGLSGIAEEDIRCRCRFVWKIVGYDGKGNNAQIPENYSDWAKNKGI